MFKVWKIAYNKNRGNKKKSNIYYTKQAFSRDCSILIWRHLKSRDMLIIQFIFLSDPIYGKKYIYNLIYFCCKIGYVCV